MWGVAPWFVIALLLWSVLAPAVCFAWGCYYAKSRIETDLDRWFAFTKTGREQ